MKYMYGNPVMDGHMDSFDTQQQQRQRKGADVGVGRLNTSTYHSLQYYRQVHNQLMFHYWFPCMLRLSATPLPKMNSELTSMIHAIVVCFWLVLCVTCYLLRSSVVRGAWWFAFIRFFTR